MSAKKFLTSLFDRFVETKTTTLAASLSYYTALSLAPLLILFIAISSKLNMPLQQTFLRQMQSFMGPDGASAFELVIQNAKERPDLASVSSLAGFLTLLFSASLIFGDLRSSLNQIFNQKSHLSNPDETIWQSLLDFFKKRIFQIGLVISFLFLMILSLMLSSFITASFSSHKVFWVGLNILISLSFFIGLFGLLFRYLPESRIQWRQAFKGGLITAFLFVLGKELIGLYLGNSAIGSAYGAAGSLIILLVWVYYSALITFIGAHVSSLLIWKDGTQST
jgi:membrane protein